MKYDGYENYEMWYVSHWVADDSSLQAARALRADNVEGCPASALRALRKVHMKSSLLWTDTHGSVIFNSVRTTNQKGLTRKVYALCDGKTNTGSWKSTANKTIMQPPRVTLATY